MEYRGFKVRHIILKAISTITPDFKGKKYVITKLAHQLSPWPRKSTINVFGEYKFCADFNSSPYMRLYLLGEHEPHIRCYMETLLSCGDVFIDGGANFGLYTVLGAKLVGDKGCVYSFEPLPKAFEYLKKNMRINGFKNIYANRIALANETGVAKIYKFKKLATGHASLSDQGRHDANSFSCKVVKLDEYSMNIPDDSTIVIKLDVEGSERDVLFGSEKLLHKYKPSIILEINYEAAKCFGYTPEDLFYFLADKGYSFFYYSDDKSLGFIDQPDQLRHGTDILCICHRRHQSIIDNKYLQA